MRLNQTFLPQTLFNLAPNEPESEREVENHLNGIWFFFRVAMCPSTIQYVLRSIELTIWFRYKKR